MLGKMTSLITGGRVQQQWDAEWWRHHHHHHHHLMSVVNDIVMYTTNCSNDCFATHLPNVSHLNYYHYCCCSCCCRRRCWDFYTIGRAQFWPRCIITDDWANSPSPYVFSGGSFVVHSSQSWGSDLCQISDKDRTISSTPPGSDYPLCQLYHGRGPPPPGDPDQLPNF